MPRPTIILALGDLLALAIITLIGFASHGELAGSFLMRAAALYVPLCISWFLLARWFGLLDPSVCSQPRQLWRVAYSMLWVAPLSGILRGLVLNEPIPPIFVVVLIATSSLALLLWRGLYALFFSVPTHK
ncbi:MAG TPA: DUF3054 domain-containing protein [Anaerolineales bacterium]|jgi:hypothetical protein